MAKNCTNFKMLKSSGKKVWIAKCKPRFPKKFANFFIPQFWVYLLWVYIKLTIETLNYKKKSEFSVYISQFSFFSENCLYRSLNNNNSFSLRIPELRVYFFKDLSFMNCENGLPYKPIWHNDALLHFKVWKTSCITLTGAFHKDYNWIWSTWRWLNIFFYLFILFL